MAIEHIQQLIYQHIKEAQATEDPDTARRVDSLVDSNFVNDDYRAGYVQALKSAGYLVSTVNAESLLHKLN